MNFLAQLLESDTPSAALQTIRLYCVHKNTGK